MSRLTLEQPSRFARGVTALFFATIFVYFTRALTTITDFWWHLSTGRWIWEHGQLPAQDPFLFTTPQAVDLKQALILKGYWLAQLFYYLLSNLPQEWWCLLLFKATLFTTIFYIIYRYLRQAGVDIGTIIPMLGMLLLLSKGYDEIRPQVFTFLGAVLLLSLLDQGLPSARSGKLTVSRLLWLPLLMIFWANLHQGFIIGCGILLIYGIAELRASALDPAQPTWKLPGLLFGSALCGFANPNLGNAFILMIQDMLPNAATPSTTVSEYRNPLHFLTTHGESYQPYLFVLLTSILVLIVAGSWRKLSLSHKIVFPVLLLFGCLSFRYTFIALSAGIMIAGRQLPSERFPSRPFIFPLQTLIAFVLIVVVWINAAATSAIARQPLVVYDLSGPTNFIKAQKPEAPIFNPYEWGGHLIWSLGNDYQFYTDARTLDYPVYQDYRTAISGMIESPFKKHHIKTVLFRLREISTKKAEIPLIVIALLQNQEWELAYADSYALIFLQKATSTHIPRLDKDRFITAMTDYFLSQVQTTPYDADLWLILGQLSYTRGDIHQARYYCSKALALEPDHALAKYWMNFLR